MATIMLWCRIGKKFIESENNLLFSFLIKGLRYDANGLFFIKAKTATAATVFVNCSDSYQMQAQ